MSESRLPVSRSEEHNSTPRARRLDPDPELWEAIGGRSGLRSVLQDFYTQVYSDSQLAPFFEGVRQDYVVDKQFSFLRSILTGERNYFGNHPRKAHSWMVISPELFDHREDLLETSLIRHGVTKVMALRVRRIDDVFRKAIIKKEPFRLKGRGPAMDGELQAMRMDVGILCDFCEAEVTVGDWVSYHTRTGKTWCSDCRPVGPRGIA